MATDLSTATPTNPFFALNPHFGLLLGVEDLFTLQGYAAGKARLHNAWLHGSGVVWGLNVLFNASNELEVDPGFALDGLGRELHVDNPKCIDLALWYAAQKDLKLAGLPVPDPVTGKVTLELWVTVCFQACLSKAVPAIADTCGTPQSSIAYSRITEDTQIKLALVAPAAKPPFHKLRVLFGLDADDGTDGDVLQARANVLALSADQQPAALLTAFRRFAAVDVTRLEPAQGKTNPSYPVAEPGCVTVAKITATLQTSGAGYLLVNPTPATAESPVVDASVRTSLVPTATIQELLCGPFGASASGGPPPPPPDAGGPRFDHATVALSAGTLSLVSTGTLMAQTVDRDAFTLNALTPSGWATVDLKSASLDGSRTKVSLELKEQLTAGTWARLVVSGTGAAPLLGDVGADLVPLAGELGGASGTKTQGNDFIHFWKVS